MKRELKNNWRYKDTQTATNVSFDPKTFSASAVLSTPSIDRDDEIVIPEGCVLDAYAAGPAPVFLSHQASIFPVGSSKQSPLDPDCPLSIVVSPQNLKGTCFFNTVTLEAEQTGRLVELGHIGAVSIGFLSIEYDLVEGEAMKQYLIDFPYRKPVNILRHKRWELTEWSWVGIGANREGLSSVLSSGKIAGKTICPVIKKAFSPFAIDLKTFGVQNDPLKLLHKQRTDLLSKLSSFKQRKGSKMADENQTNDQKKPGQMVAEMYANGLVELMGKVKEGLQMVDNDDVTSMIMRNCQRDMEIFEDITSKSPEFYDAIEFPEFPEFDFSMIKADEEEEDDEDKDEDTDEDEEDLEEDDSEIEEASKSFDEGIQKAKVELAELRGEQKALKALVGMKS